jgi:hypothetical protein
VPPRWEWEETTLYNPTNTPIEPAARFETGPYVTTTTTAANHPVTTGTTTTYPVTADPWTLDRVTFREDYLVTRLKLEDILDNYFRRVYKIIQEHTTIDISEEEFMNILKE